MAVVVFVVALVPRITALQAFLTTDELTHAQDSGRRVLVAFLDGRFEETYWQFYPGVTMSWLEGIGIAVQYGLDRAAGIVDAPLDETYLQDEPVKLIHAARIPFVLVNALGVALVYLLARKLWDEKTALLGALLLALDPFHVAHSRVLQGDAVLAVFMVGALFAYIITMRSKPGRGRRLYLLLSAVMASLAALTKPPSFFLFPFALLLAGAYWLTEDETAAPRRLAAEWAAWSGAAFAVFVLLWPAMWVNPVGTIARAIGETTGKVEAGHLVFFMGSPTLDPGPWFYPYVVPFRMTPPVLIGVVFSAACVVYTLMTMRSTEGEDRRESLPTIPVLWAYVVLLLLLAEFSPKKQDRYLLPLFPALDLLAAAGWVWLLNTRRIPAKAGTVLAAVLVAAQAAFALPHYPYYLTYFNEMMGGLPRAVETTLVGWGEGMEQAAAYLNKKPGAEEMYVASNPAQTFLPYFKGTGENMYTNDVALRADYVVLYVGQVQRLSPSPEIIRYFQSREPERVITVRGVPYAWIYPGPRMVTAAPQEAQHKTDLDFGDGIRLVGYDAQREGEILGVTLYWGCYAKPGDDYAVSVRLLDEDGGRAAQQDGWPADGLLPTSLWREGEFIRDSRVLVVPGGVRPGSYRLEVVVYRQEGGEVLGGPLDAGGLEF